ARERWLDARLAELTADERAVLCRAAEIIDRMAST
ncbi:MAG: MarR family transcriptional regulator, partial [Pseudonocardiaceae bacterium]